MENLNNKSNQEGSHDSQKESYNQLWLELEPRLKKPKKKKRGFVLFWGFTLLMTASYFVYQANAPIVEEVVKKRISTTNPAKVSVTKQAITEAAPIESSDNALEDIKPIVINRPMKNAVLPFSSSSKDAVHEQEPIAVSSTYIPTPLPTSQSPFYKILLPLIGPLDKVPMIKQLPLVHLSKKIDLKVARVIERGDHLEGGRLFSFGLKSSFLFYSNKKSKSKDQYITELNNSLSENKGFELELSGWYEVNPKFELGLAINYTILYEVFRLRNSVQTESHIFNPQAFSHAGSYISAHQCLTTTVNQNVQNNNRYQYLSIVPSLNYKLGYHNWQVRFGAGVPIIIYQNYSGTLFDEEKLIIHDGPVFERNRFNKFGIQLSNAIHYTLKNNTKIGLNISYRKLLSDSKANNDSWQNSLSTFGLGLDVRKRF